MVWRVVSLVSRDIGRASGQTNAGSGKIRTGSFSSAVPARLPDARRPTPDRDYRSYMLCVVRHERKRGVRNGEAGRERVRLSEIEAPIDFCCGIATFLCGLGRQRRLAVFWVHVVYVVQSSWFSP